MKIRNKKGKAIVSIETDGFLYCYKNEVYLTADWPDNMGSVGRILSIANSQNEACTLSEEINYSLTFDEETTEKTLSAILQIFPSAEYKVSEILITYLHQLNTTNFKESASNTVSAYYPYMGCNEDDDLVLTQSKRFLNPDRVEFYKKLIKENLFPRIVVLEKYSTVRNYLGNAQVKRSPRFIVDGHHKLKAYEALKIPARAILFSYQENSEVSKKNIENKEALILDVWHFFNEENIYHFIKHHPQCFVGNDKRIKEYNTLMDNYLRKTNNLRYGQWADLIRSNYQSQDPLKREWVLDRLKVIFESTLAGSVKSTYLWNDKESRRLGNAFYISNMNDFDVWTEKAIGIAYSKLANST